jgi:hypothetical protein
MQLGKKISALTMIWLVMAALVIVVWYFRERREQITLWVFPIDFNLVEGGWERLSAQLDTMPNAGILLEMDTFSIQNQLSPGTGDMLLSKLQASYPALLFDIAPDSLHLKAMQHSRQKAMDKLDESAYRNYQTFETNLPRWRTRALLEKGEMRDSLLQMIQTQRQEISGELMHTLYKRYSQLMLRKALKIAQQNPDKRWVMLVDIEHYALIKEKISSQEQLLLYEP